MHYTCGSEISIKNLLLECRKFNEERSKYLLRVPKQRTSKHPELTKVYQISPIYTKPYYNVVIIRTKAKMYIVSIYF